MVTLFAIPKAFRGHTALIQHNAIGSWARLGPSCWVVLFGDDDGTAEATRAAGVEHEPSACARGRPTS